MAQKVTTELVCDLTGDPADETVQFGIGGKAFEVDLTKQHADALREILDDYVRVARPAGKLGSPAKARSNGAPPRDREHAQAVRAWLRQQGHVVSDRGRISGELQAKFDEAH